MRAQGRRPDKKLLERVVRGVYRRSLPEGVQAKNNVSWDSALLSLQWIMEYEVHLGGVSALDLAITCIPAGRRVSIFMAMCRNRSFWGVVDRIQGMSRSSLMTPAGTFHWR
ncbi:hypothetical protein HC341_12200 [Aquisalimonas sp. 2447]|nr:hypothetical protein HC341_12200 [Aquisalimonas sp. 2447]